MGKKAWEKIIVSNTKEIPGKKIIKTIKYIKLEHDASLGFSKHSKWAFSAPDKLKKMANKLGANAITAARFAYRGNIQIYSGYAVIVEDED